MQGAFGLSAIGALLGGVMTYCILFFLQVQDALLYAILAAALVYALLHTLLRIVLSRKNKRYAKIEQELGLVSVHKVTGQLDTGAYVTDGRFYFCDDKIVCVSLEKKSYSVIEILRQSIGRIDHDEVHLQILTRDGSRYILTLPDAQAAYRLLDI